MFGHFTSVMFRCGFVIVLHNKSFVRCDPVNDLRQAAVLHHHSVIDNDEPLTQFLYVSEIMCGQYDRRSPRPVYLFYELAKRIFRGNVKANRRFIQE